MKLTRTDKVGFNPKKLLPDIKTNSLRPIPPIEIGSTETNEEIRKSIVYSA